MTTQPMFSRSEEAGLYLLAPNMTSIYSVGISTGGLAEIRIAELCPQANIIATTLDSNGIKFSEQIIDESGLSNRITTKLEDVSQPLPYEEASFDYVYARLVLHYLTKQSLPVALAGLYRVLKPNGKIFVVVRSAECPDAHQENAVYHEGTGLTEYIGGDGRVCFRYFHTPDSIRGAMKNAGFKILSEEQYDEQLFMDYERQQIAPHTDNVLEVIAQK